jgi:SAM-dependent methyltransferase
VAYEVVERDDGLIATHDIADYFLDPREWSRLDRWALERLNGRVLDIGCGAGRHSVVAREAGREVVAIDPSPGAVAVTCDRGVPAHILSLTEASMSMSGFDTLLLMGNNLGLLQSATRAPRVLAELARLGRPGARLLGYGTNPYDTAATRHRAYHQRNVARGRMAGQLRLRVRYRDTATPWFDYLMLSVDELTHLVVGSAWQLEDVTVHGSEYVAHLVLTNSVR